MGHNKRIKTNQRHCPSLRGTSEMKCKRNEAEGVTEQSISPPNNSFCHLTSVFYVTPSVPFALLTTLVPLKEGQCLWNVFRQC